MAMKTTPMAAKIQPREGALKARSF